MYACVCAFMSKEYIVKILKGIMCACACVCGGGKCFTLFNECGCVCVCV